MTSLVIAGGVPVRRTPFPSWPYFDSAEARQVLQVLESRSWGGYNSKVGEFEKQFARYLGAEHCVTTANGTVSLQVALRVENIGPGDEVILPPYTFIATATAVLQVGAVPVFVDIEPQTLNLDPECVKAAITRRTRAVIPVHFAGHSADMGQILDIARAHHLVVIEDAAHAHGGEYMGRRLGTLGEWGSFSFQATKVMTSGEGGCLVTQDEKRAERVRSYCNHGRRHGHGWYEHFTVATNYRITGFQAGVLLAQLGRLDQQIDCRERNSGYLRKVLSGFPGIEPLLPSSYATRHSQMLFLFRFHAEVAGMTRQAFESCLTAEGIPVQQMYPYPLYQSPVFEEAPFRNTGCPVVEASCEEIMALPINVLMGEPVDMGNVVSAVQKIYENRDAVMTLASQESSRG
ncbi:MAG: DegT/DnrJ/EryC1/StrS family aminotransferase [Acidobacteria bacterium]|nr:DegT/DnrJ/EryC1/StrS family aminotransferase [Acidobacteriota bacterium]